MADVNYSITGQVQKGSLAQSFAATGITASMGTAGVLGVTLALGTSTQAIVTTSLSAVGLCFARNLGTPSTHAVTFGRVVSNTLHDAVRLKAGEAAVLRLAPGSYAAKADAAGTTRVVLTIYED
jgi:hypothetical protein